MSTPHLNEILLLLGGAVGAVVVFQRFRIPSVLAYLFVGLVLGPHVVGVVDDSATIRVAAEFGIVFLLFTIGLSFSRPHIRSLQGLVFGLGTAQVLLTVLVIGLLGWMLGLPLAAAFVVGAAFAQSSTAIITRQLSEQGEDRSRHGRLGTAMSVFQDVTAVPFVVVIPVLGSATLGIGAVPAALALAIAKAALAFVLVLAIGRLVLRPLFHTVASSRSAELFTLTVLFVSLLAAAVTGALGVSLAFGAFLAGMVLGETEFRHQAEATIRPFRDVLLGLFFVAIGLTIDLGVLAQIWPLALLGGLCLLAVKVVIVAAIAGAAGLGVLTGWRCGYLLAVGGEFGFALVAIGLDAGTVGSETAQIVLGAILFSMLIAPFLIRYNGMLATRMPGARAAPMVPERGVPGLPAAGSHRAHVIICGFGRIGQAVAAMLEREGIPFVAFDLDPRRVRDAHLAGKPVYFGDSADPVVLGAAGVSTARLVVVSYDDVPSAQRVLRHISSEGLRVPVMVRTRDEDHRDGLMAAGAADVVSEIQEASMMIGIRVLQLLEVPLARVARHIAGHPHGRYEMLREHFTADDLASVAAGPEGSAFTRPVVVPAEARCRSRALNEFDLAQARVVSLVRDGERIDSPDPEIRLQEGDVVVLSGSLSGIDRAERQFTE